ncbi:MAG: hypothetical protein WBA28_01150 [Microbacteriaceae bacterium]
MSEASVQKMRVSGILLSVLVLIVGALLGLWMAAGRALFGAGGDLVPILMYSMLPAFVVVQFVIAVFLLKTVLAGYRIHARTIVFIFLSWMAALGFGFMVPDSVQGELVSAFSKLVDPNGLDGTAIEFAIGFSNPLGILSIGLSVVAAVLAWVDSRGRRLPSRNPYENLS